MLHGIVGDLLRGHTILALPAQRAPWVTILLLYRRVCAAHLWVPLRELLIDRGIVFTWTTMSCRLRCPSSAAGRPVLGRWPWAALPPRCARGVIAHTTLRTTARSWPFSLLGFWDSRRRHAIILSSGFSGHYQDLGMSSYKGVMTLLCRGSEMSVGTAGASAAARAAGRAA